VSTCTNAVACPCDEIFKFPDLPNPDFVTNLSGLAWQMPVTNKGAPFDWPTSNGGCVSPADVTSGLAGAPNQLYNVELLFRGVAELATYTGGSLVSSTGSRMMKSGSYTNDGHNLYKLIVSDPPAVYFLNNWNGVESYAPCYLIRYSATIQIRTGATITLHADAVNSGEITNFLPTPIIVTVLPGEPDLVTVQNPCYDPTGFGQFLECSVISITPA